MVPVASQRRRTLSPYGIEWRPCLLDLGIVLCARGVVSLLVLRNGFVALSDDDFSRAVIAEQFALSPSLDPSGTSWLPAPFWGSGTLMALFGVDWAVARWGAVLAGLGAAGLVWASALILGLGRAAALLGAVVAVVLPYSALLGVAAVPDYPTAALLLFGAVCAAVRPKVPRRPVVELLGATALLIATLSRYEAWPVALGFSALLVADALGLRSPSPSGAGGLEAITGFWSRRASLWWIGLVPLAGPLAWMCHGVARHGDAWFFVKRVAEYQSALGGAATPWVTRLIASPLAWFRWEPELMGVGFGLAVLAYFQRYSLRHWVRPAFLLSLVMVFLMIGDVRQAGATHHQERSLLVLWLGTCLFSAEVLVELIRRRKRGGMVVVSACLGWIAFAPVYVRPKFAAWGSFAERSAEIRIGRAARELASPHERLVVDTPDYGFFAVIAAFGDPSRAQPLDDRDPRRKDRDEPTRSLVALRNACGDARWLVVHRPNLPLGLALGAERSSVGDFSLIDRAAPPVR